MTERRPVAKVVQLIIKRLKDKGFAQVEGYNRFGYVRETDGSVIVSREAGKDTPIPLQKIESAIEAVRKDANTYTDGPGRLKKHGLTHINSPLWALLHLCTLNELRE